MSGRLEENPDITLLQVKKSAGHAAPAACTAQVEALARAHHADLVVDCTRAYHFGARYNVELEIILPGDMTVRESHDIALELQHKVWPAPWPSSWLRSAAGQ